MKENIGEKRRRIVYVHACTSEIVEGKKGWQIPFTATVALSLISTHAHMCIDIDPSYIGGIVNQSWHIHSLARAIDRLMEADREQM